MFSVQYPFTISAAATFPTDTERATALGLLSAAITAASFLVSILVANRVYARFGVSAGALLLPIVYLAGFAVWLVQFSFPTAAAFRFSQQVTQRGLSNASWSAFYNVVPAARRAQVLAFNDGIPGQLGTILSGVLLLAAGRVLAPDQLFWLGAITAVVATVVVIGIRRGYGQSLVTALRSGTAERVLEGGPGVAVLVRDPSVGPALVEAMAAPEPGVRELAASMLGSVDTPDARSALHAATADADAGVRLAAIRAIGRSPTGLAPDTLDLEALATDPDPRVRAAVHVTRAQGDPAAIIDARSGTRNRRSGRRRCTRWSQSTARRWTQPLGRPRSAPSTMNPGASARQQRRCWAPTTVRPSTSSTPSSTRWRRASTAALDALADRAERSGQDPAIRPAILRFRAARGRPHHGAAQGSALSDRERGTGRGVPGRRPGRP